MKIFIKKFYDVDDGGGGGISIIASKEKVRIEINHKLFETWFQGVTKLQEELIECCRADEAPAVKKSIAQSFPLFFDFTSFESEPFKILYVRFEDIVYTREGETQVWTIPCDDYTIRIVEQYKGYCTLER